ncbi:MAG: ATP-dependent helicase, partial [Thermoplasmata archaeon]|nr:ATP-dependent helicase [Thermoplasmata archaeon]
MIHRARKLHSKEEVLAVMEPLIRKWFSSRFSDVTEPQAYAVPLIHRKKSVLVSSPTGSGKTLTAFLAILNELYRKQTRGRLENRIYCVYISPLKALANDIERNLLSPLEEMRRLAAEMGMEPPEINVAVRTGDTSTSERARMSRRPPHILITTPESLALVLAAPKFGRNLSTTEYVIVDEIHEISSSKRGAMLTLNMERLEDRVRKGGGRRLCRIGLSATQAPIEEIAAFLAGYEGPGEEEPRDIWIADATRKKRFDIRVLCPVEDMNALPFEVVNERMYDILKGLIERHRTTLVFTNTRKGAEAVAYKLQERGLEGVAAHHGSLSKETRLDVEGALKEGRLRTVVSSTSLELGIDIGYVDLVCQIGSPKSIAKGLQRIGRSGHRVGGVPRGRLLVFENDDLVECAVLAGSAARGEVDRVSIPRNTLDILAQTLVGMSLERRWNVKEVYDLVRRSYTFHHLPEEDFLDVLTYLGDREADHSYSKLWYDRGEETFGIKRGSRTIYYLNMGTIPEESNYRVYDERGRPLGSLSESFVERLTPGDIFVLGAASYEHVKTRGMKVFVRSAPGRKPTLPSWTGEMLPRSFDLSIAIGRFRRRIAGMLARGREEEVWQELTERYFLDEGSARSIINYFKEQMEFHHEVPTDKRWLIEGYVDRQGKYGIVFHTCYGRRVHDALARAYAFVVSNRYKCGVSVTVNDDAFMLSLQKKVDLREVVGLLSPGTLERVLREAVKGTELFKQRFRHCATRSFMVLRNYRGREISLNRQQGKAERALRTLMDVEEHPVVKETYNEVLNSVMDLPHAREVLEWVASGRVSVSYLPYSEVPSPFAHGIVLAGISDIVLMEDRSTLLKELHRRVLEKILSEEEAGGFMFTPEEVEEYFSARQPRIGRAEDILDALHSRGPLNLLQHKGDNIFAYATDPEAAGSAALDLIRERRVVSLWHRGLVWTPREEAPFYTRLLARSFALSPLEEEIMSLLDRGEKSVEELEETLGGRWDAREIRDALGHLERGNRVCRVGLAAKEGPGGGVDRDEMRFIYAPRPPLEDESLFGGFLDRVIRRTLWSRGPLTVDEIEYWTGIERGVLVEHLRNLERAGEVASGRFVIGDDVQYMLSGDVASLKAGEEVFSHSEVSRAFWLKHTAALDGPLEYLERYGLCGFPLDIYNRCGPGGMEEWMRMRERGDIVEARVDAGRVAYCLREDLPLFVAAHRRADLSPLERRILDYMRERSSTPEGDGAA